MPLVPLRVAVELTGKDRSTLTRAIESGKLSATKNDHGRYLVDPAELERVYGALRTPALQINALPDDAQAVQSAALARELELTREMLTQERALREREQVSFERERSSFDRERQTWEEERTFLRGLLDKHTDQIKLLTDQRERQTAAQPRSLLARIFNRG